MHKQEIWRPVSERPSYEVSNLGRVRSPRGILAFKPHPQGYQMVTLAFGKPYLTRTVHSLVIGAFEGQRPEDTVVAHRNGDKKDNRFQNLIYVNQRDNLAHSKIHGSSPCPLLQVLNGKARWQQTQRGKRANGERHGMASVLTEEKVMEVHMRYLSVKNAAKIDREMGLPKNTSAGIIAGRRWRHLHPDATLRR